MARSEAARAGTRGSASGGGGSSSGGTKVAAGGNQYAGYRGPIGTNTPTADAPGSYGLSGPETRAYNSAKTEYQNRDFGKRLVDFLSPLKSVDPQINQPSSYQGGQYHHGFNPAGAVAGLLSPYGSGLLTGPLAGSLYNNMGGHNVVLTGEGSGWSTSYPDGGPGYNSSTGYGGPAGQPNQMAGKGDQSGLSHLQTLASLNQGISGNHGAPQAVGDTTGPATPTGPNWAQMMASMRQITPGYAVNLPGYKYTTKATV